MKVRVRIREQLCLLIATTSLLALMILALSTWFQSRRYLQQSREQNLQVTASLKSDQITQDLRLFQESVQSIATRDSLQGYVTNYNNGNTSQEIRDALADSLDQAISEGSEDSSYLQAAVWSRDNGTNGDLITRVTGSGAVGRYSLPYNYSNGSSVYLGDPGAGYPPTLYPNLTFNGDNATATYDNVVLKNSSALLLGPMYVPENNVTLISMTVAILDNSSETDVLGWLTVVLDARDLYEVVDSRVGLGSSGEVLIIGPDRPDNLFDTNITDMSVSDMENMDVQFKLPPYANRHPERKDNPYLPFPMRWYPAVTKAWSTDTDAMNNAGTLWDTHNENNESVAVGYATVDSPMVDWVVVFSQSRGEVQSPINSLRDTVLACIFSVMGAIIIVCIPIAHYAVKPIRALRTATENSTMIYETYAPPSLSSDSDTDKSLLRSDNDPEKGILRSGNMNRKSTTRSRKIRAFQIPQKVPATRHFVHDELTDLTGKFNDMSEELTVQYAKLEDRVKDRTAQLEKSRNEAEAANESKTLFIANVSHELRTPLNGIIGMCAVAMQEEDVNRIRQSLKIIYKSSDLLLHLLNDLLTFSRTSYGQQLSIEENTFRLVDVGSQLVSIFEKQAQDAEIGLKVVFLGPESTYPNSEDEALDFIEARRDIAGNLRRVHSNVLAQGPADVGPLREVGLEGDKNRILQILMNLVGNSLKFTPAKGQIEVRIRCRGICDMAPSTDDMSNATTLADTNEAAEGDIPQITVRKTSGNQILPMLSLPAKGLVFDFEVEDTGPGIPEHLQKEVFKPFVQGDLALSKKHGGTGLGLSICSQLAELMGGSIKLKSTPDVGSTFTLTLPLRYTKEKVPSVSGSLAASGRRGSHASIAQFETLAPSGRRGSLPSIAQFETLAPSGRRGSLASITHIETFSNRSARSQQQRRQQSHPHSRRGSYAAEAHHVGNGAELEDPRLVGLSQPIILDNDDTELPQPPQTTPRRTPNFRRVDPLSHIRPRLEMITSTQPQQTSELIIQALSNATTKMLVETPDVQGDQEPVSPGTITPTSPPATCPGTKAGSAPATISEHVPGPSRPKPLSDDAQPLRILVAEDNAVNQQVILRLLKLEKVENANITLAEDGEFALEAVQRSLEDTSRPPYSLVFMDIQMPRMDGIEATMKIRELGFEAPIVALTAFDHETNRKNCEDAGMNGFLGKPIKRTALKKVLAQFKPGADGEDSEDKKELEEKGQR